MVRDMDSLENFIKTFFGVVLNLVLMCNQVLLEVRVQVETVLPKKIRIKNLISP